MGQASTNWDYLYIFARLHTAKKEKNLIPYYLQDNKSEVVTTWEHLHYYARNLYFCGKVTSFIKEILSWSSLKRSLSSSKLSPSQHLRVNDYEIVQTHWGQCSFSNLLSLIRESGFYRLIISDLGHFPLETITADRHLTAENLKWFLNQWWDRVKRWVCSTYREQAKYIIKITALAVKKRKKKVVCFPFQKGFIKQKQTVIRQHIPTFLP